MFYADQKDFERAEKLELKSIAIYEKTVGADHPDMAITLDNLCEVYQKQGRLEEGQRLRERALKISEKSLGATHPFTLSVKERLEQMHKAQVPVKN